MIRANHTILLYTARYACLHYVVLRCIKLKDGRVLGDGPLGFVVIFEPPSKVKSHPKVNIPRNALWLPILVRRNPDKSVTHCRGRRSRRGLPG